jgi:hypothetical protein
MKTKIILSFFLVTMLTTVSIVIKANDTTYINKRYMGGAKALRLNIQLKLKYPSKSVDECTVGTSLSSVKIKNTGEILEIKILNSLSSDIDDVVINALGQTKGNWLKDDKNTNDTIFYFQIQFKFNEIDFFQSQVSSENLLDEIFIIGYGGKSCKNFIPDEKLIEMINLNYKSNSFEKLLPLLNESIRRNPFYCQFYQMRVRCYKNLNMDQVLIKDDNLKLSKFIDNKTINDILVK